MITCINVSCNDKEATAAAEVTATNVFPRSVLLLLMHAPQILCVTPLALVLTVAKITVLVFLPVWEVLLFLFVSCFLTCTHAVTLVIKT